MIIYKVKNKLNSKVYIGQTTKTLNKRWKEHCQPSMVKRSILSKAIQKYGPENFTIQEIDGANNLSELNYLEKHYILKFNSLDRDKGYNIREGGNNSNLNSVTKEKIRKTKLGNKHSVDTKNKMRNSWSSKSIDHFKNKVLDGETGKIYNSVTEASKHMNIPRRTLVRLLSNKTNPSKKYRDLKLSYYKEI